MNGLNAFKQLPQCTSRPAPNDDNSLGNDSDWERDVQQILALFISSIGMKLTTHSLLEIFAL